MARDASIHDGKGSSASLPGPRGQKEIVVTSHELANEVCNEKKFHKLVASGVYTLRQVVHDGLFTGHHDSHAWAVAHRILRPIFGPLSVQGMFDEMNDIAEQLCLKWARFGEKTAIDVASDFTRLTLDTIALCLMDHRFNSFYLNEKTHPFVESMMAVLGEADLQSMLPECAAWFRPRAMAGFRNHTKVLRDMCHKIVDERRRTPVEKDDFLNAMIHGRDPESGDGLDDDAIVDNLITFLVAGHETTSGMLSFAVYYLLEHPKALSMAQAEVDRSLAGGRLTLRHLQNIPYIDAVLRETLRLMPTAPGFYVTPFQNETIGGKYHVKPGESICVLLDPLHRDPKVWGLDADKFKPERMLRNNFDQLPSNSWKPFGNGLRGCVGRSFAWQEAQLILAMLLRDFSLAKYDPDYKLRVKHLLTIKPDGFKIRVALRHGRKPSDFYKSLKFLPTSIPVTPGISATTTATGVESTAPKPITILYGSDTGTCEALAQKIALEAYERGFAAVKAPLNDFRSFFPTDCPIVIIAASYNGEPSRNAAEFYTWVTGLPPAALSGIKFAVFACGHSDWRNTLYQVPQIINKRMLEAGSQQLVPMGKVDTAYDNVFEKFQCWTLDTLWPMLCGSAGMMNHHSQANLPLGLTVNVPIRISMREGFLPAVITDASQLSYPGVPRKRHLELRLPESVSYSAGAHVQILPRNDPSIVKRALSRFGLEGDQTITINSRTASAAPELPLNTQINASDLLSGFFELNHVASVKAIVNLIDIARFSSTKQMLKNLATKRYQSKIRDQHMCLLNVLELFPREEIPITFSCFLAMIPPMRPRTYSFSSSPRWQPGYGSLTYGVVEKQTVIPFKGLASNYLASLEVGDVVYISVTDQRQPFTLMAHDQGLAAQSVPQSTPIIMIAVGSGLAPFRGLIQDRLIGHRGNTGHPTTPALLFFGCRGAELDDLYRSEFDSFEKSGVVTVRRAFSHGAGVDVSGNRSEVVKGQYITEKLRESSQEIRELWNRGAMIYFCGGKKVFDSTIDQLTYILGTGDIGWDNNENASPKSFQDILQARIFAEIFA
ncbi:hypothetical protein JX266_003342 [Neoarthrinium moseri]|nr:hypothetical protein JX266_003342 [Neoarthrinium moseri]